VNDDSEFMDWLSSSFSQYLPRTSLRPLPSAERLPRLVKLQSDGRGDSTFLRFAVPDGS